MAKIEVTLVDAQDGRSWPAEVVVDKPIGWWIDQILQALTLPREEKGRRVYYQFALERSGRVVGEDETLESAEVQAGDILRLERARIEAVLSESIPVQAAPPMEKPAHKVKVPSRAWRVIGVIALCGLMMTVGGMIVYYEVTRHPVAYLVLPTGTPTSTLTAISVPTLLGDGGRIAFASTRDGNNEIYVMDTNGANVTRLTNEPSLDSNPAWSSDGRRIAFMSYRDGNYEVYVMGTDGSNVARLTNDPAWDGEPAWSPDGTHIAFTSSRDDPDPAGCYPNCRLEIYAMDADGSNVTRLTGDPAVDWGPAWSPDGRRIAFTSERDGNTDIYVMDADGSNVIPLTNAPSWDGGPAWSPDGRRIAFASDRDSNYEIYVMDTDGSHVTCLTNNPSQDDNPVWSPDGSRIAFISNRDGNFEIYVMDADGSNVTNLTQNPADDGYLAWSPVPVP